MASWSTRRKSLYLLVTLGIIAIAAGVPLFLVFYKAPTCSDGKQNGGERGVDCGGSCARLCPADFALPKVLWSYSSRVVPGVYNALAYVQNPNQSVEARGLSYLFKLYDSEGILVSQRTGTTFVPAGQKFAVFEGGIQTGERVPVRTTFEFSDVPQWMPGNAFTDVRLLTVDLDQSTRPSAEVKIKNESIDKGYANVNAFIVLYDKDDNRVDFSKTVIDTIAPGETKSIYFTWPQAFPREVVRSEVLFVNSLR